MSNFSEKIPSSNVRANLFLIFISILTLGVTIATAIDFGNISKQNSELPTTYFSESFSKSMSIINWIIMGICIIIFFYAFYNLLNANKIKYQLEQEFMKLQSSI
jgi:uncharacterized BrkB/YihY/UPF0761 family membrane protein